MSILFDTDICPARGLFPGLRIDYRGLADAVKMDSAVFLSRIPSPPVVNYSWQTWGEFQHDT